MPKSQTSPDPKAPDMPTMPADEMAYDGQTAVMNESVGGYTTAHDANKAPTLLMRPAAGQRGMGTAVDVSMASAYLPSPLMPPPAPLAMTNTGPGEIPRKKLGATGIDVSVIGIGGSNLGDSSSLEEAVNIVHMAVDAGVNFMDNAWEYNNHRSEDWMGRALAGRRDKVVLMTKCCTHGRSKQVAMQQLEESLLRLKTDYLDVWQIHECVYYNDPENHFADNGVWEAMRDAKQQGKVKFIGFTGHKTPQIHLRMLALSDERGLKFDTCQMPLNPFDATYRSFQQYVVPECLRRGIGVLGMKSMAGNGASIQQGVITAEEALKYAMSLPASTTISGIDSLQVLAQNLSYARDFKPMSSDEMIALARRVQPHAADGHLELYKSTKFFDAGVGRAQHDYPSQDDLPI